MSQPDPDRTQDPGTVRGPDPADEQTTAVHPAASPRQDPVAPTRHEPVVPTREDPVGPTHRGTDPVAASGTVPDPAPTGTWRPPVDPAATAPAWSTKPVAVRRADPFAALCLLLAGVSAALSLALPWTPAGPTGYALAEDVVRSAGTDWTDLFRTGLWQPGAVLAGGALLFVVGLLLLVPARAHRFLGVVALLVAGTVVAAVLVPSAARDWQPQDFDLGFAFAVAVAGLGLLGALKAVLTGPKLR